MRRRGGRSWKADRGIPLTRLLGDNGTEEIRGRISSACLGFPGGGNPDTKCFAGCRLYSAVMVRVSVLLVVTGIGEP